MVTEKSVMENAKNRQDEIAGTPKIVVVWDIPTRIFHWLLVVFVLISFVTGNIGGNAMQYHLWSGYMVLTVLLFRIVWGLIGGRESRFVKFVKGPAAVARYATTFLSNSATPYLGHNPLGGWSIIAMLLALLVQADTGLFANDDIITEGPLFDWVSKPTSDWLTQIHKLNQIVIIGLVCVHVLAILFYFFYKRENLITPMITGAKQWNSSEPRAAVGSTWKAALTAGLAALAVYLLVR
jgi:cytochrome b